MADRFKRTSRYREQMKDRAMTAAAPTLFVAGIGRCGTTMTMAMLDAGGFPVAGPRPSYEPAERWRDMKPDVPWLRAQSGKAVKWINPMFRINLPDTLPVRPIIILLSRRPREQAKSQIKIAGMAGRANARAMKRAIERDTPVMSAVLKRSAGALYKMSFETILADPAMMGLLLGKIVRQHFGTDFNPGAAADAVINRSPKCLPHLKMEATILPALGAEIAASHARFHTQPEAKANE